MNIEQFKKECSEFLDRKASIYDLRALGRKYGVRNPTEYTKKSLIIEQIVNVVTGIVMPTTPSGRGAPIKNVAFNPDIEDGVEELRIKYLSGEPTPVKQPHFVLEFKSPEREREEAIEREVIRGQLEQFDGGARLLPENCKAGGINVVVPEKLIIKNDLREGDIISCRVRAQDDYFVAVEILSVNDIQGERIQREKFDELTACYPYMHLRFFEPQNYNGVANKYMQWFTPFAKGQRGCVFSSPKAGATTLLKKLTNTATALNEELSVFVLLTGQFPEAIGLFRDLEKNQNFVYTSYEDDPEKQVFAADFLLKRAKRFAECGKDVLLIVDSFTALARAYNDCDYSTGKTLVNGLESKTVQYLKKYLGAARCFEKGGSITILGALSENTGNPADDYLVAEMRMLANFQLTLDDGFARKGFFPALKEGKSSVENATSVSLTEDSYKKLFTARSKDEFLRS